MNKIQRQNPRVKEKQHKMPFIFRSYKGLGPCRAWKNSAYKSYPMIFYKNQSLNLSLSIFDGSIVSGSDNPKLRKQHVYRAAKMMKL